ncbi:hypothetical protein ES702_00139 [subsurface metagenome]
MIELCGLRTERIPTDTIDMLKLPGSALIDLPYGELFDELLNAAALALAFSSLTVL